MDSQGMKNARKMLENMGWTEGSGLGANNDGITEALKPTKKSSFTGVGYRNVNEFQWWDHAFNKAAKSFDIKVTKDEEVIVEQTQQMNQIKTTRGIKNLKKDKLVYGNFHKTGTLSNGIINENSEKLVLKEEKDYSLKLSDEELFKLCKGLTAHKGARHGLTAAGKLARIAQQEAEMLASMDSKITATSNLEETGIYPKKEKRKKSKNKTCFDAKETEKAVITESESRTTPFCLSNSEDTNENEILFKSKKKKKSKKEKIEGDCLFPCITQNLPKDTEEASLNSETMSEKQKKKKKKTTEVETEKECLEDVNSSKVDCDAPQKKKKKKHHSES